MTINSSIRGAALASRGSGTVATEVTGTAAIPYNRWNDYGTRWQRAWYCKTTQVTIYQ
ncbi:MAG: hypothetical protein IPH52_25275 [Leptospiraceae bacterium]|nr:hypothetical protein [Leptospiraceae bacterium]